MATEHNIPSTIEAVYVGITDRINMVLDYDGIAADDRAAHLSRRCGFSKDTARRLLNGKTKGIRTPTFVKLQEGLDVDFTWLGIGEIRSWHPRTWRIYIQCVKGFPPLDAAGIVQLLAADIMGHHRAKELVELARAHQISYRAAAQMLHSA